MLTLSVFANKIVDNWNSLSNCFVNCTTLNTFKTRISEELDAETDRV